MPSKYDKFSASDLPQSAHWFPHHSVPAGKQLFFPSQFFVFLAKVSFASFVRLQFSRIKRYKTYEKSTEPVIEYYKKLNLLKVVDGERSIDQINKEISDIITLI